jgi:hypothetical protein
MLLLFSSTTKQCRGKDWPTNFVFKCFRVDRDIGNLIRIASYPFDFPQIARTKIDLWLRMHGEQQSVSNRSGHFKSSSLPVTVQRIVTTANTQCQV